MISKLERLLSGGTVTWDRLLVTDGLSPEAVEQITAVSPAAPDRVWVVIDHDTPAGSVAVAEKQKALLDWARQTGAVFRSGRGIGYALLLESRAAGGRDRPLRRSPCRGGGSRRVRRACPCLRRSWLAHWRAGRSPCPRLRCCGWQ